MGKRKIAGIILTVSIFASFALLFLIQFLSILDVLSEKICFWIFFALFIFLLGAIIGSILLFTSKKAHKEILYLHGDRIRCSKCSGWIDITGVKMPTAIKCKKCGNPVLLDIEEEDVKVQCPGCKLLQVHHILYRPAEVDCRGCGVTLKIPRKN